MDEDVGEELLVLLQQRGWEIQRSSSVGDLLPAPLQARYPHLPTELTRFLEALESCFNQKGDIWFFSREDYRQTKQQAWHWNEQELMSLEGAEGDAAWQAEIRSFWDRHFPFMMALHSDYDYLAVNLDEQTYGAVVYGFALEFEEPSTIAPSFTEFLKMFKLAAASREEAPYPLNYFLL